MSEDECSSGGIWQMCGRREGWTGRGWVARWMSRYVNGRGDEWAGAWMSG